uniref:ABC transporter ATP-binding protein n=1 Tax=Alistipes sp. TaxID=1872444 RepID=UPI0040567D5B
MISLHDISVGYGEKVLLRGASATFLRGELTALVGRNGSGKSTLLRALARLESPLAGHFSIDGTAADALSPRAMAEAVSFVSTERLHIAGLSVWDVVALGRAPYTNWLGRLSAEDHKIVEEALKLVGMEPFAPRGVASLSDGEFQRVMIARALAQQTPAILLDEPTSFLDLPNRYELCSLLARLAHEEKKCILFSTHELDIALSLADKIALIDTPELRHLSTTDMAHSGHLERLFSTTSLRIDPSEGVVRIIK